MRRGGLHAAAPLCQRAPGEHEFALPIPQNLEPESSDSDTRTRRWLSLARIALVAERATGSTTSSPCQRRSPDSPEPRNGLERLGDANSSLAKPREDRALRRTSDWFYHLLPL
ncbi:hypothetical protein DFP72DRAFT_1082983 [Ephemerocybe angulata]|uniref:Uncharacterized protein n=1 Tax=Ephemerocybe angulata TaxID=980116 RepID=A0A8H6LUS1_9AGAR|nr:hypothetical protein DFP72DRAFT_1082983 [Tulosesus angulatus]